MDSGPPWLPFLEECCERFGGKTYKVNDEGKKERIDCEEMLMMKEAIAERNKPKILQIGAKIIRDSCVENQRECWKIFKMEVEEYEWDETGSYGDYHLEMEMLEETRETIKSEAIELQQKKEKLKQRLHEMQKQHMELSEEIKTLWRQDDDLKEGKSEMTIRGREKQLTSIILSMTRLLDTQNREMIRMRHPRKG